MGKKGIACSSWITFVVKKSKKESKKEATKTVGGVNAINSVMRKYIVKRTTPGPKLISTKMADESADAIRKAIDGDNKAVLLDALIGSTRVRSCASL